jgi:hypothetical protein
MRNQSESWIQQSESLITRSSRYAKSSAVTTWKMKLLGSTKKSSEQMTLSCSQAHPNLEGEIPFKGVGL